MELSQHAQADNYEGKNQIELNKCLAYAEWRLPTKERSSEGFWAARQSVLGRKSPLC
jgi:hypothetical protein